MRPNLPDSTYVHRGLLYLRAMGDPAVPFGLRACGKEFTKGQSKGNELRIRVLGFKV
jgi:hypothetical protein